MKVQVVNFSFFKVQRNFLSTFPQILKSKRRFITFNIRHTRTNTRTDVIQTVCKGQHGKEKKVSIKISKFRTCAGPNFYRRTLIYFPSFEDNHISPDAEGCNLYNLKLHMKLEKRNWFHFETDIVKLFYLAQEISIQKWQLPISKERETNFLFISFLNLYFMLGT